MESIKKDILDFKLNGSWKTLNNIAEKIVKISEEHAGLKMNAVLGGGTRLMLDLEHRISYDIDLFITNPQWLNYITPRLNDELESFNFSNYKETPDSLKLSFKQGEIDFIVATNILNESNKKSSKTSFSLDFIEEVLAKKIYFRGYCLTSRDLFDWYSINLYFDNNKNYKNIIKNNINKEKFNNIYNILDKMLNNKKYKYMWDEINGVDKPPLEEAVKWLKNELENVYLSDIKANKNFKP